MSGSSNEASVLIVDPLPLRSLGLAAILERLFKGDRCHIEAVSSPSDVGKLVGPSLPYRMIMYNVGGASVADTSHRKRIRMLRALGDPIVIFSDNDDPDESVLALTIGAQGFLHAGMSAELARQALTFIFQGGTYFPPPPKPKQRGVEPAKLFDASTGGLGPARQVSDMPERVLGGAGSSNDVLTERQISVLKGLRRGDSNKAIARELGLREGTVKVHVRQIMRKLGVANRTKAAIACANVPEIEVCKGTRNGSAALSDR
jgi:DNA-binding NarL/FixJ family response regulator